MRKLFGLTLLAAVACLGLSLAGCTGGSNNDADNGAPVIKTPAAKGPAGAPAPAAGSSTDASKPSAQPTDPNKKAPEITKPLDSSKPSPQPTDPNKK
jgi:hypothetical protein